MQASDTTPHDAGGRLGGPRAAAPGRLAFAGVFGGSLLVFLAVGAVLPVLPRYVRGAAGRGPARSISSRPGSGACWPPGSCSAPARDSSFTDGATWVIDLAPVERRGRIIGLFGLAMWGGPALGPLIGVALDSLGGYDAVWAFATISPLCGALVARSAHDAHDAHDARAHERARVADPARRGPPRCFGFSTLFPSLVLLVVERVAPERRGAAVGAFTAFFDAGVAVGGPLAGAVSAVGGYPAAFWVAAGFAAGGMLVALSAPPASASSGRPARAPEGGRQSRRDVGWSSGASLRTQPSRSD